MRLLVFAMIASLSLAEKRSFDSTFDPFIKDMRADIEVGDVIVPVIGRKFGDFPTFLSKRYDMFCKGIYPGVEFTILDIQKQEKEDNCVITVRPAYPLIKQLERDWPITVKLDEIPYTLTKGMYNAITVLGSALLALSFFATATIGSQFLTFSVINSRSMMSTIIPKDIILVEKVSPFIKRNLLHAAPCNVGDVVFFSEPANMEVYLQQSNLPPIKSGDLIVKRVLSVQDEKKSNTNKNKNVNDNLTCFDVRGDNPSYSVDSRNFGCVPSDNIVGKPLLRVLPLNRAGFLVNHPKLL